MESRLQYGCGNTRLGQGGHARENEIEDCVKLRETVDSDLRGHAVVTCDYDGLLWR